MKKTLIISGIVVSVAIIALIVYNSLSGKDDKSLVIVKKHFNTITG